MNTAFQKILQTSVRQAASRRLPTTSCRSFHATTLKATTIVCVRKDGHVCMMGDGMVSQGSIQVKPNAVKIRRIPHKGDDKEHQGTIVGFAGSTADAFTLLERLEMKLDEYPGQLARSCVELAKGWRTDKYLRRLEASLIVADATVSLELTGNGDVIESHDGILGVGSGSPFAIAAARALMDSSDLDAEAVARKAMNIAADMCIYTNKEFLVETMETKEKEEEV
jgi:ATP-dependent HslUV protease subunit HslV